MMQTDSCGKNMKNSKHSKNSKNGRNNSNSVSNVHPESEKRVISEEEKRRIKRMANNVGKVSTDDFGGGDDVKQNDNGSIYYVSNENNSLVSMKNEFKVKDTVFRQQWKGKAYDPQTKS